MFLYPCWVFAASSVCGDYNSSLKSTVKTYLLHVVAWWAILWGLFTSSLWLGGFEMDNPFISSSLIHFWRQELRGRGAGTSLPVREELAKAMWGAEERGGCLAKCCWGKGSRARNKPLPAGHLAASLGLLMAVLPACPVPGSSLSGREAVFFGVETCSPFNYFSIAEIKIKYLWWNLSGLFQPWHELAEFQLTDLYQTLLCHAHSLHLSMRMKKLQV